MKNILHKVINFWRVEDKVLLDSVLVVSETIEDVRKKKKKCIIVKVEYEKTYYSTR